MEKYTITSEISPNPEDVRAVMEGLRDYNYSIAGDANYEELHLFLRDEAGTIIGGLLGETHWGWLHIRELWVDERLRGKGFGTKLVTEAEEQARERNCHSVHLDTYSFQARGFYERLGYTVYGTLEDYPTGHHRIFMRKTL
jgi:ribosomal protein S18 acetylase RimI-like enzyme